MGLLGGLFGSKASVNQVSAQSTPVIRSLAVHEVPEMIMQEFGINRLSEEKREKFFCSIFDTVYQSAIIKAMEQMSDHEQEKFASCIEVYKNDVPARLNYMHTAIEGLGILVHGEIISLKNSLLEKVLPKPVNSVESFNAFVASRLKDMDYLNDDLVKRTANMIMKKVTMEAAKEKMGMLKKIQYEMLLVEKRDNDDAVLEWLASNIDGLEALIEQEIASFKQESENLIKKFGI